MRLFADDLLPGAMLARWLPPLLAGLAAWGAFLALGDTPPIRASGLALVIVGVTLILRRLGAILAMTGGLALAFSQAFWSQTGGSESLSLPLFVGILLAAGLATLLAARFGPHQLAGLAVGLSTALVLLWALLTGLGSLRLTTLLTAWVLYLLIDALRLTNPRPEEGPSAAVGPQHTYGLLLLLVLGVINDPLFTLLAPAIVLALALTNTRLPLWYWAAIALIGLIGLIGVADQYVISGWLGFPAAQAEAENISVPFVMADGWREATRWISLFALVREQFTIIGVLLGVLGLARMARWYPDLGVVTMVAYAAYALFGLVYFGRDAAVLLLPLLMIQIIWITYAVYTFGQWLQRTSQSLARLLPPLFMLLPLLMLTRII